MMLLVYLITWSDAHVCAHLVLINVCLVGSVNVLFGKHIMLNSNVLSFSRVGYGGFFRF